MPDERVLVREALVKVLLENQEPRGLLKTIFATQGDRLLTGMDFLPNPAAYADQTITVCLRDGWTIKPALLETLLRYLVDIAGAGMLATIATRVHDGIDPNPSPYDDLWLGTDRPFFDRAALRGPLKQLVTKSARPILRVKAADGAFGMTYSRMFIEHVTGLDSVETMAIGASVSRGNGPSYDARDLAEELFRRPGITDPLPDRGETSNYARSIVRFVLTRLMAKQRRWVVVLDGFGQPDLSDEAREAVEGLAASVASSDFRDRVRLVLLDYPRVLPEVSAIDILEEEIVPAAQISAPELGAVIAAIQRLRLAEGLAALAEPDIPAVVKEIVEAAPPAGRERLVAFNEALLGIRSFTGGAIP